MNVGNTLTGSRYLDRRPELTPELAEILEQYLLGLERGKRARSGATHPAASAMGRAATGLPGQHRPDARLGGTALCRRRVTALQPCRQLGDYQIIREIGRGGMGVVYEAQQLSLVLALRLKVLPQAIGWDPRRINRFWNEAQAAAQLQHPHIVPVYWVGCEEGVHCYAMQYVEGRSLECVIREVS